MTLILIDAKNAVYRFGYAMSRLHSSEGVPTGAIYGFLNMLLRLKKKYPDGRFIIAWDGLGYKQSGWRRKIFPGYKASRGGGTSPVAIETLWEQEAKIKEICRCIGIGQTAMDEVEADDIIGVIAAKYAGEYKTVIYSTDKDFIQLVPLGVTLIRDTGKHRMEEESPKTIEALFSCKPKDVLKVRAICGDKSDNIPGAVKGVAKVGAAKLIASGADPSVEFCKVGRQWNYEAWAYVFRNYRIMRILQSTNDKELDKHQQRDLDYELARIEAHVFGVVKSDRSTHAYRNMLKILATLDLNDAMSEREALWELNVMFEDV